MGFLNLENVRLAGYVPEDFADGNLNKVLSVVWQIILKYQIQSLGLPSGMFLYCVVHVLSIRFRQSQGKRTRISVGMGERSG